MKHIFFSPYANPHPGCPTINEEPSLTEQQHAQDCDINFIVARANQTGIIDHVMKFPGRFGDFTNVPTYTQALEAIIDAENAFMDLPSHVRRYFENDPAKFIDFASDESNREELIRLGLAHPRSADTDPSSLIISQSEPISEATEK